MGFWDKTKKALKFVFVESLKGVISYEATKRGVEDGGTKAGKRAAKEFKIQLNKKF